MVGCSDVNVEDINWEKVMTGLGNMDVIDTRSAVNRVWKLAKKVGMKSSNVCVAPSFDNEGVGSQSTSGVVRQSVKIGDRRDP